MLRALIPFLRGLLIVLATFALVPWFLTLVTAEPVTIIWLFMSVLLLT